MTAAPASATSVRQFAVGGMDCAACAAAIERAVRAVPGVAAVDVDVLGGKVRVTRDPRAEDVKLAAAIRGAGYTVESPVTPGTRHSMGRIVAAGIAGACLATGTVLGWLDTAVPPVPFLVASLLAGAVTVVPRAWQSLRTGTLDINVLMTIAAIGAAIIGEWGEAAAAMSLFALAQLLEGFAMGRARRAIAALMQLTPREATVRRDGRTTVVPVDQVALGEVMVIRPGERLPLDGEVVAGQSAVDQSPITGESMPVEKQAGGEVFAGSINGHGALEVRVTRHAEDTTLARILHAVEEAQASRAPAQTFVNRFARIYTPAVVALATLVAILPPLVAGGEWLSWVYRALALLVIACPCALVISTPVTVVSGLTGAARDGVLIKGGAQLESAAHVTAVLLDKTGTLTEGRPAVTAVTPLDGLDEDEVLRLAAAVEGHSEHPVARAIIHAAAERGLAVPSPTAFQALPGRGAKATVDGQVLLIGNSRICADTAACRPGVHRQIEALEASGQTAILLTTEAEPIALLAVADRIRPGARASIEALRHAGVRMVGMVTGDNAPVAHAVAGAVGITEVHAALLPEEKLGVVRALREAGQHVAVVGDGVNDAPALAAAHVGIAMGAAGTHVALETADVVLMGDDLEQVAVTIRRARRTVRIIQQNVAFSIGLKAVFLALALTGHATLWMAVAADMGASLLVIVNGLRALRAPAS